MAKKDKLTKSLEPFQEKSTLLFRPPMRKNKAMELEQLRRHFPGIYADYSAGRLGSLRLALQLAGLRPERNRLQKLQNSWTKADSQTREQFLHWLEDQGHLPAQTSIPITTGQENTHATPHSQDMPIANGRYLLVPTIARLEEIMNRRNIKPADIMQEMGFDPNDRSLLKAIVRKTSLRLKLIQALENWLKQQ